MGPPPRDVRLQSAVERTEFDLKVTDYRELAKLYFVFHVPDESDRPADLVWTEVARYAEMFARLSTGSDDYEPQLEIRQLAIAGQRRLQAILCTIRSVPLGFKL